MNADQIIETHGKGSDIASEFREKPLWYRLKLYLDERFPVLANGLLILSFYSSNQFLAHALYQPGLPMRYDLRSLLGMATILGMFLHMRIFDDHKDYASDCRYFPDRILQQGIISLRELKLLAAISIIGQATLAVLCGTSAVAAWAIAFLFTVLMLKEFFIGTWLKQRFLIYASVHMLIMPLLAMTVWCFSTARPIAQIPGWYWLYSSVSYFLAFNWEISRKIRVPEDEVQGVDSYTRIFGTYGAANLVMAIRIIATALVALVGFHLGLSPWFYFLLVVLFLICMIGFIQYRLHTTTKTAKRMELYSGIYILSFDLALAVELGRTFGIQFSGSF